MANTESELCIEHIGTQLFFCELFIALYKIFEHIRPQRVLERVLIRALVEDEILLHPLHAFSCRLKRHHIRLVKRLEKDVHRLQLERDVLEKAGEILKKEECVSLEELSNREKAVLIDALKEKHRLQELLSLLKLFNQDLTKRNESC